MKRLLMRPGMARSGGLIIAVSLGLILAALPVAGAGGKARSHIVVLKDHVSASSHARRAGLQTTAVYSAALRGYAAPMSDAQVRRLRTDPSVESVEVDLPVTTGDPARLKVAGSPAAQTVTPSVERIGADESLTAAIDGTDERVDVDIAIIDTGIQKDHPDLNVVGGRNCVGGKRKAWGDGYGHGTHVAGLAAALDNDIGVVGVAPGARLWSARVLNKRGFGTDSTVLCGIDWVTARADVIEVANLSLGRRGNDLRACGDPPRKLSALHKGICRATRAGVTVVVSAGNEGANSRRFSPAGYPEVITVSAMADSDGLPGGSGPDVECGRTRVGDDHRAGFSNWGGTVDISAPGVCVLSTFPGSRYATFSGTSMSSPLVAGAAALYRSTHPAASPAEVRQALIDRREPAHIPGDPDAFDEGVLDVSTL